MMFVSQIATPCSSNRGAASAVPETISCTKSPADIAVSALIKPISTSAVA